MVGVPKESREASYSDPNSGLDDDAIARKILCAVAATRLEETPTGDIMFPNFSCSSNQEHASTDPSSNESQCPSLSPNKASNYDQGDMMKSPKQKQEKAFFSPNSPRTPSQRPQNLTDLEYCEDLVVATAVHENTTEDSDDGYLPTCVEYDPDSKPASYRSVFYRRIGYCFCGAVLMIIVAIVLAVSRSKSVNTETEWMREEVRTVIGMKSELQEDPYRKALNWMMYHDPIRQNLHKEDSNFLQRYIMTYFYFATSVDGEWAYCAPPQENDEPTCLYQSDVSWTEITTNSRVPKTASRWLSDLPTCNWAGVQCNENNQINQLLSGTLRFLCFFVF
jgi:hypothetical protein